MEVLKLYGGSKLISCLSTVRGSQGRENLGLVGVMWKTAVELFEEELFMHASIFSVFHSPTRHISFPSSEPADELLLPRAPLGKRGQFVVKDFDLALTVLWLRQEVYRAADAPCLALVAVGGVSGQVCYFRTCAQRHALLVRRPYPNG